MDEDGDVSELRKCYRCGALKPVDEFAWRRRARSQRDSFCRPCRSAYGKKHYAANRARYIAQAAASKDRLRLERTRLLFDYFALHPCADCGEDDPVVLEFDHLGDKAFTIGGASLDRKWETIVAEIAKCEVVCANCHRRRTSRRRGGRRTVLSENEPGD